VSESGTAEGGELRRVLGTRDLVIYYVSSLVGAGILVVPGIALDLAGPASLVAWLLLAFAAFPIAAMFARFSANYPSAAGVSYLVRRAFGHGPGLTIGLFLLVLNLTTNPILGLAAARYLAALLGWQDQTVVLLAGLGVMLVSVVFNMFGITVAARAQMVMLAVMIGGILLVIAAAAPAADPVRLTPFAPYGWTAVGGALVVCFFSFFGWENVSHYADEVRDPQRSYPRAARWGALALGLLYLALALAVTLVVPADAETDKAAVLDALLRYSHGGQVAVLGSVLAVAILIVTTNAWVCGASRLLYAMSRDGHVWRPLGKVWSRNGAPVAALAALGLCYVADIAVLIALERDERFLVAFVAASILIIYIATFLAGFRLFSDRPSRALCAVALLAVTAFFLVGGVPSGLAAVAFAVTVGYVLLRRRWSAGDGGGAGVGQTGDAEGDRPAPPAAEQAQMTR